jgi:hypothetical protein
MFDWFILMDFLEALSLLKAFSAYKLRVFKEFAGFPVSSCRESGNEYVVFADASLAKEGCYFELRDFAEMHNLSVTPFGKYLMFSSQIKMS